MKLITQRWQILTILVLAAMLVPIWIGPYPPLYDYPNHLLEAQIVAHYDDPHLAYADSYDINPAWYLRSNALSTLMLIGLGRLMSMYLAGQLVLSLYLVLFVGGLVLLLQRSGMTWPLLLLAPPLAYNYNFTTGWLNFCYATALGLFVLVVYLRWQETDRPRNLLGLGLLLGLVYMAHLMVWGLLLVIISAMISVEPYRLRRHGLLLLAMNSAFPFLLITRPLLAGVVLLIGPLIWGGLAVLRRLHLKPNTIILGGIVLVIAFTGIARITEPLYQKSHPELTYSEWDKLSIPWRTFTLPHQYMPLNPMLIGYNLVLLILILAVGSLLTWSIRKSPEAKTRWLIAMGLLGLLYFILPSRTSDIWVTEPRVLLLLVLVALPLVDLSGLGPSLQRVTSICLLVLCLWSVGGTIWYAHFYAQQTQIWHEQMSSLAPAKRILLLRAKRGVYLNRPTLLGSFNRFYDGQHLSTIYVIEQGGFSSIVFNNGPVRPRPDIPIPAYDWPGFSDRDYVAENCAALRESYEAVLFWGNPDSGSVIDQLDQCFSPGPRWADMAIWYHPDLQDRTANRY